MTRTMPRPDTGTSDPIDALRAFALDLAHGMQEFLRQRPETGGAAGPCAATISLLITTHLLARRAAGVGRSSAQEARAALDALQGGPGAAMTPPGQEAVWAAGRRADPFAERRPLIRIGLTWAGVISAVRKETDMAPQEALLLGLLLLRDAIEAWQRHGDVMPAPSDANSWILGLLEHLDADPRFANLPDIL